MPDNSIYITGSTGFVGAAMVRHFYKTGWSIHASGRSDAPKALLKYAQYVKADLGQEIPKSNARVVVHAAAMAMDKMPLKALFLVNLEGTRRVFDATKQAKIFVFISSSSVYDYSRSIHEEMESVNLEALSPYGRSKRAAEDWLLQQDWSERTLIILRPRAIYGPGDRILLPRLLQLVHAGRIIIPGDMRIQCSMTHIDNLCAAVERSVQYFEKNQGGTHVFNIADQESYEMRSAVQALLSKVNGKELEFTSLPIGLIKKLGWILDRLQIQSPLSTLAINAVSLENVLDQSKIQRVLDYWPAHNFWDTLDEIEAWVKKIGIGNIRNANPNLPWLSY